METPLTSTTNDKRALCILASPMAMSCLIILLLCIHHNQVDLSRKSFFDIFPTPPSLEKEKPSKTDGPVEKPSKTDGPVEKPSKTDGPVECDVFEGRWVYKPLGNPSYNASRCPFLSDQVSCQRNGRPDAKYEKWSWEPTGCAVPSFNAIEMLERLRGKRVIMVGDSLNRNQWESLACLVYSSIPSSRASVDSSSNSYKVLKAKDYNVSIEFYWSPFLVQLDAHHHANNTPTKLLMLDKIEASSDKWRGADVMVFNSGHWWAHMGKLQAWDSFHYMGKPVSGEMKAETALAIGMRTWARWVDTNVDSSKTTVFFRSISLSHHGKNWCPNRTEPLSNDSLNTIQFPHALVHVVERTIQEMRTPVKYLNITKLSHYRVDAHPTFYATKRRINYRVKKNRRRNYRVEKNRFNTVETPAPDCSHWCLPGVPDTWNRLLYASFALDASTDAAESLIIPSSTTES